MNAIEARGLSKSFGSVKAVRNLALNVPEGTIYGFLGPNGAGKSTTINMMMGFVKPDGGTAKVLGLDVGARHYEIRKLVGYIPERPPFYENMSAAANMRYFGRLIGIEGLDARIADILEQMSLKGREMSPVRGYSQGMRQRLGIAIALLGRPKLLIMDEPTTGLDPQGSRDVRAIIRELKAENVTVFLSSHILHEVQEVCDFAGIIRNGRMIAEMPIDQLLDSVKGGTTTFEVSALCMSDRYVETARAIEGVRSAMTDDGRMRLIVDEPRVVEDVNIALVRAGLRVREIKEIAPTLEDAFLKVVGQEEEETEG